MATVSGTVKAKSANKFGFGIMVNDKWYNSKFELACNKGDEVVFDDGGKTYVRDLKVTTAGSGGTPSVGSPVASKGTSGVGYARGVFPIPTNDGSRAIVRQNSITNAVALVTGVNGPAGPDQPPVDIRATAYLVVDIARIFEKYSAGDMDEEINAAIDETFKVT